LGRVRLGKKKSIAASGALRFRIRKGGLKGKKSTPAKRKSFGRSEGNTKKPETVKRNPRL